MAAIKYLWILAAIILIILADVVFLQTSMARPQPLSTRDIDSFLTSHWQRPVPLQGELPSGYSPLEASLKPEDCGTCHAEQYTDWKTARHRHSMDPGVLGQILKMTGKEPATVELCQSCHAPLSEQLAGLRASAGSETFEANGSFSADLQSKGLICAACHVRHHRRFGPPPRGKPGAPSSKNQSAG